MKELEETNDNLQLELQMEREEAAKAMEKAKEWRERQLNEITDQKDREIEKLKLELKDKDLEIKQLRFIILESEEKVKSTTKVVKELTKIESSEDELQTKIIYSPK